MATASPVAPRSFADAAGHLAEASASGRAIRVRGAGTKPWTDPGRAADAIDLETSGLAEIVAHDPGDMTATLQAGVPLAEAQRRFAAAGQTLMLDPPTGTGDGDLDGSATIGGIVAAADAGPLAHRYGGPRDLIVGATVALGDGTIARSGGTVIKNVAGYDVAKLLCGSFGTLGLILSVNVRLHPVRPTTTVRGQTASPSALAHAARTLARLPAELEALDVGCDPAGGVLLARCAGAQAPARAERIAGVMRDGGLAPVAILEDDAACWAAQRAAQRSRERAVVAIAHRPSQLGAVLAATERASGSLVARVALGDSFVTVDPDRVHALRADLPPGAVAVLRDCPPRARAEIAEPWGAPAAPVLGLARALKDRFDPAHVLNPGTFVGGI